MTTKETLEKCSTYMPSDQYYAVSEDRHVVTPENIGGLIEYPALFHAMIGDRELRPALSEAMSTGRAMADFLTMSAEEFLQKYEVADGPVNPKTGKPYGADTKAYAEWRAVREKTPVSTEQFNMFGKMALAYNGHAFIKSLGGYTRVRNATLTADIHGVACMCRIDNLYIGDDTVVAVDTKTTSDLCGFARSADSLHYREQQALIRLIMVANGVRGVQTRIAAIEKGPMPRCGVFGIKDMEKAMATVDGAIGDYSESMKTGNYRTMFEAQKII